ncbi:fad dependent oxidoreductase superfamily [Brettanomyces bruxellensis AWRI1499]|nr:fad dependent oxidoreductase superfamily [Brettanomyces bruxellensis AWRI1499]
MEKNPNPDPVETKNLIENAKKRFPELLLGSKNEFEIRRVNVGFRPARRGGAKVKKSVVAGTTIIDCYGFAGSGMEMSWGAAEKVVSLLENDEAIQRSKL